MPASRALSTGARNAVLSTTATAMPSAFAEIAEFSELIICGTTESCEPVHWKSQPSSAQASRAPYWVGVKNGLVVTWLTNTNFHFGVAGNAATPPWATEPASFLLSEEHAASSADAAAAALTMPAPPRRRRRATPSMPSVSMASSTLGWTFVIAASGINGGISGPRAHGRTHTPRPPPIRAVVRYFEWRSKYLAA